MRIALCDDMEELGLARELTRKICERNVPGTGHLLHRFPFGKGNRRRPEPVNAWKRLVRDQYQDRY